MSSHTTLEQSKRLKEILERKKELFEEADRIIEGRDSFSSNDVRGETGYSIYELVKEAICILEQNK